MANNIEKQSFGQAGATYLSGLGSALTTGAKDICAITFIADSVIASTTSWPELTDSGGNFDSDIFPAGVTIYGQFTQVTLTSGAALCYHAA